jgi:hypothetical protein
VITHQIYARGWRVRVKWNKKWIVKLIYNFSQSLSEIPHPDPANSMASALILFTDINNIKNCGSVTKYGILDIIRQNEVQSNKATGR